MRPLSEMPKEIASKIAAVFTDIDDTLTTDGKLTPDAFSAMWRLHDAGIHVIPVTGRPAGWCDHIARMWPVAGVIGENGAFSFRYDRDQRRMISRFVLTTEERGDLVRGFGDLTERILREVPGAAVAGDQPYRIHDLAIDFAEDVGPLPSASVDRIVALFEEVGATAKVSSIHVNGWFGAYDKLSMITSFASQALAIDLSRDRSTSLYAGDSPNDQPAFAFFPSSVGVANVRRFLDRLSSPPSYVTEAESGRGFTEIADHLLKSRT